MHFETFRTNAPRSPPYLERLHNGAAMVDEVRRRQRVAGTPGTIPVPSLALRSAEVTLGFPQSLFRARALTIGPELNAVPNFLAGLSLPPHHFAERFSSHHIRQARL